MGLTGKEMRDLSGVMKMFAILIGMDYMGARSYQNSLNYIFKIYAFQHMYVIP